jgi:4-amino-4-deoxy-L-arabinose transferase-like glycosyltransferase
LTAPDAASVTPTDFRPDLRTTLALHLALLLCAAAVLFFVGLGRLPLLEPDEGRNAEVAREMLASGDWITPHFNGFAYLDKPAVYFWMVAASLKTFGISEGAARLPSALMAAATMLLVWFLAHRMFGQSVGLRAGIVFASCPLAMVFAREVIFDMTLTFFVTLAMVAFWLAEDSSFRRPWLDVLMFGAMGVAIITKGPVGVLLPLLSVLIYEAVRGRWRELRRLRWGLGLLVFILVALPWFIAVSVRNPDFPRYAFWDESLKRFATGNAHRGGGIFYYIPVYLGGFFPWSLFLLLAGWNRLRRWRELKQAEGRPVLFLLCWTVWVFGFFTVSQSKLPGYFLPAVVPLSILMGLVWRDVGKDAQARSPDWLTAGFALLLGIGILVAGASHSWVFASAQVRLAKKLHPGVLGLLKPSLLYSGLILCALAIVGRNLASRMRGRVLAGATFALVAAIVPMLVLRWLVPLRLYAESDSSRRLAATILASPEKQLPLFGYYCFRTSLPFYLRRPVGLVSAHWGEMTSNYQVVRQAEARRAGAGHPGEGLLLAPAEFHALANSTAQPLLVMVPNTRVGNLSEDVGRIEPLWNEWDLSIWEVSPAKATPQESRPSHIVSPFQP